MIKFLFIIGNPVHSNQEQLILDLIPRALHSVACSQVEKVDGDCSELLHSLAAEPSDSWEKTTNGLKCSVDKATFELLFDASFADVRGALRNMLKQPAARRVIVYVGAVGQNAYKEPPSSQTLASGCSCSSAWLLRDAQVGPAELAPVVAECEEYLARVLYLARLDRRNSIALLQNGHTDAETPIELGTVELLVPFADADWLAMEKRPPSSAPVTYTVSVGALENATASADDGVTDTVAQLAARLAQAVHFESAARSLVASDVVGNIRFARPTLYVFASGDGDAALLGVPGFAMLLDGGYSAQPAYWQLIRHLDRIDAVLVSHAALDNLFGLANILRQKAATDTPNSTPTPPVLAHALLNAFTFGSGELRSPAPAPTLTLDALKVNSVTEADELVRLLASNRIPVSPLLRAAGQPLTPINLYHKIGQGSFDLYVLNPTDCAKELKELGTFCEKFLRDANMHATLQPDADTSNKGSKPSPADRRQPTVNVGTQNFPLGDFASVCALLVYHPASPAETVTRLLFTGACPQLKVLEGLERMRNAEFLKVPEYHDAPTHSLSYGIPPSASHFGLAAAASSSRASITSPSSAASARKSDAPAGRAPPARPATSALKVSVTPAPSRTVGPSKPREIAPASKRTTNGHASADPKTSKVAPVAKKPLTAATKNAKPAASDANRPKTAPASTNAKPAATPLRKPASATNGAPAKTKPLATKLPATAAPAKRTVKDNSALLSATRANGNDHLNHINGDNNGDHFALSGDANVNHSVPLNGEDFANHNAPLTLNGGDCVNHSTHLNGDGDGDGDVNHSVSLNGDADDKPNHIELQTTNGDATPAYSQPSPDEEQTIESNHEELINGENGGEVEVEVEMTAEEFARALAAASGDPDAAADWGVSLGLPMLTDGDGDGDGEGHDDEDAIQHTVASANGDADEHAADEVQAYAVVHSAPVAETAPAPVDAAPTAKASAAGRTGAAQKAAASGSKQPAKSVSSTSKPAAKAAPSSAKAADGKKQPAAAAAPTRQSLSARSAKAASPSTSKGSATSPTKERAGNTARTSNSGSAGAAGAGNCGVPFFVDLAYIPAHGNPKYVDAEFFRRVRARYYVLSCLQPSAKVLDALLDAKATVWDSHTQTTLIPTYDSEQLAIWMTTNRERLAELQVDVAPPANRCTVQLQDHTDQCNAYRLEF